MNCCLGIEFGSTRIKATVIDENYKPVSFGDYTWQSKFENGVWTYSLDEAINGLKASLCGIKDSGNIKAVGISGMMHGYLAFDKDWNLLVPFRTWQNTITAEAAEELTSLFGFNIPQRWSIAHLYRAILNGEEHIGKVAHITTLAGYIHFLLTGVNAVGIGEASGIFPIDSENLCYNKSMLSKFNDLIKNKNLRLCIEDVLPKVLPAGEFAGALTEKGAALIDNMLSVGTPFAPPEGDAGTGMVSTNSVSEQTGNISAGTSVFSMVVLEKPLANVYPEIDIVTTPAGKDVAMVHCNNCTNDSNAWVSLLKESVNLFGLQPGSEELYTKLYKKSLEGDSDCGGVLVCNYMAGESITGLNSGIPLVARKANCSFTLANFLRATLYSAIATLKLGMEILEKENVKISSLVGHGGYFKTEEVGQKYMAAACNAPVTCMETAGEGGSYGMAVLAAYLFNREESLESFLENKVFREAKKTTLYPDADTARGFNKYIEEYRNLLFVERMAAEVYEKENKNEL